MNRAETQTGLPLIPEAEFKRTTVGTVVTPIETERPLHSVDLMEGLFRIRIDAEKEVRFTPRNHVSLQWITLEYLIDHPGSSDYAIKKHFAEQGYTLNPKQIIDGIVIKINREFLHSPLKSVGSDIIRNEGTRAKPIYRINANINRVPYIEPSTPEPQPGKKEKTDQEDISNKPFRELPQDLKLRKIKLKGRREEVEKQTQTADNLALERLSQDVSVMFLSRIIVGTNPDTVIATEDNAEEIVTSQLKHPNINSSTKAPDKEAVLKRLFPTEENNYKNFILNSILNVFDRYSMQRITSGGRDQQISQMCQELKNKGITRADILKALSAHLGIDLNEEQKQEADQARKRLKPLLNSPKTVRPTNPRPEGNKKPVNTED